MRTITKRFEYRFETSLLHQLKRVSSKLFISKNKIMREALREAGECYGSGVFHYREQSDFLVRKNKRDKIRFEVLMDKDEREILRKLAYTWKISQAEVMRIVVEYFVYVVHKEKPEMEAFYLKKVRYTQPIAAPLVVVYDILNVIEARYHMFRPPKSWKLLIS